MKSVTMKDIAAALGVSVVSVSKALAGQSGVSEELREKILRKAQELGYLYAGVPTGPAGLQGNIGILVADHFFTDNSFYSSMHRELLLACSNVGVSCLLEIVTPEAEASATLPNLLSGQKCAGILFMGELSPAYVRAVKQTGIPCMMLDFYRDDSGDDSVISDGLTGAFQLTCYLIGLGHRGIGYVGSLRATSSIMDRYLGYYKALLTHGLPTRADWVLPDRDAEGYPIDIEMPQDMPDAFVCNCDETAYMVCAKLKSLGYRIPQDISIVGFDNYRFATLADPPLTTYRVDVCAMAKVAVTRLLHKMAGAPYTKGCAIVSGEIVVRGSTAEKPRG